MNIVSRLTKLRQNPSLWVRLDRIGRNLKDIKWWILHRTTHRYNIIYTDLPPGYYDKDTLMLHGCFSLLVKYVEVELAWERLICNDEERAKVPWYMSLNMYRKKHAKRLGLENIEGGINLPDTDARGFDNRPYKEKYSQIKELYLWWTEEFDKEYANIYNDNDWIKKEEAFLDKQNDMLKKLIDVRYSLWT